MRKGLIILAVAGLVLSAAALPAGASAAQQTRSVVHYLNPDFTPGPEVEGSWGKLATNARGASFTLHTGDLQAGNAYTIWWIIFNDPPACTNPNAVLGTLCGPGDLGNGAAGPAVLYATGHVVRTDGPVSFGASLSVGDEPEAGLFGTLSDPLNAEIHLVVHDHGPVIQGREAEMTHTFDAGCGAGEPNEPCVDPQAIAFVQ